MQLTALKRSTAAAVSWFFSGTLVLKHIYLEPKQDVLPLMEAAVEQQLRCPAVSVESDRKLQFQSEKAGF